MKDWKSVSSLLFTVLLTGITAWFSFGKDTVSRAEWISLTEKHSGFEKKQNELEKISAVIETKLDYLIKELGDIKTFLMKKNE